MKFLVKLFVCVCVVFGLQSQVFALSEYNLTDEDMIIAVTIHTNILADTDNGNDIAGLVEWYYILADVSASTGVSSVVFQRLQFVMADLRHRIDQKKNLMLSHKNTIENSFLTAHGSGLYYSGYIASVLPDECFAHYDMVDDVARSENIPTSLVIATWKMESGCGFYYPNNGDGPFQMLYKNATGTMTISKMVNEIQDFAAFTRNKWDWYNRSNLGSGLTVGMSYTGRDLTGVVTHGALYNGLSGASIKGYVQPANPNYVRGRYTEMYSGANKDGLLGVMLKVLRDRK